MSGDATLNGLDTVRGDLKLPYSGAWTAEIELNADSVPTGSAVLELMSQTFRGSVIADPSDATQVLSGESGGWYRCHMIEFVSREMRQAGSCVGSPGRTQTIPRLVVW